jgi:hypothetical protein
VALAPGEEATGLIALARWFAESGGAQAGRMARHDAPLPAWAQGEERPAAPAPLLQPVLARWAWPMPRRSDKWKPRCWPPRSPCPARRPCASPHGA